MDQRNRDGGPEIRVRLLRTPEDPPERDPAFQQELNRFKESLRAADIPYSQHGMAFDSVWRPVIRWPNSSSRNWGRRPLVCSGPQSAPGLVAVTGARSA